LLPFGCRAFLSFHRQLPCETRRATTRGSSVMDLWDYTAKIEKITYFCFFILACSIYAYLTGQGNFFLNSLKPFLASRVGSVSQSGTRGTTWQKLKKKKHLFLLFYPCVIHLCLSHRTRWFLLKFLKAIVGIKGRFLCHGLVGLHKK